MKVFFAFFRKELRHVLRDRRSLLILIGMPIVMLLLYGFALSNEVKNSRIAILDPSQDDVTRLLTDRLDASRYFTVVHQIKDISEADALFRRGEVRAVVVFESQFQRQLLQSNTAAVQIIADASDTNTGNTIAFYATQVIQQYQTELLDQQKLPYRIQVEARMVYNPQLLSAYNFVPGVMGLVLILLCAMLTAVSIVREKETGTMELILVSPAQPWMMIAAKALPFLLVGLFNVCMILVVSYTILGLPMRGNLALIIGVSGLFVLTALSLGLFISTRTGSQQVALFISLVGLLLPSLVFSGFMFPIENMPRPLQIMSNIAPTKYYFNILKAVMIKGLGFSYIWRDVLVLVGMTTLFLVLAIRSFKVRLA
jgi:ABC-2 type transport system permease protein